MDFLLKFEIKNDNKIAYVKHKNIIYIHINNSLKYINTKFIVKYFYKSIFFMHTDTDP